jgi:hypothetical protein
MKLNVNPSEADEAEDQYHKILAIMMKKLGIKFFTITADDIDAMVNDPEMSCIMLNARGHELDIELMTESEARRVAAAKGVKLK